MALGLEAAHLVDLALRVDLGQHAADPRGLAAMASAAARRSPVTIATSSPMRSHAGDGLRAPGFTRSRDGEQARRRSVHAHTADTVRPDAARRSAIRPAGREALGASHDDATPSTVARRRPPAARRVDDAAGSQAPSLGGA